MCPDKTGRFAERPYYEECELDLMCEQALIEFAPELQDAHSLAISTDTLTKLIERDAEDLDLYADLSSLGPSVEGLTRFYPGRKPEVRVASRLGECLDQGRLENRLRTTLSHEYGHIMLHRSLYDTKTLSLKILEDLAEETSPVCKRENILHASSVDWMEWQAGYCCGALLMPITNLKKVVQDYFSNNEIYGASIRRNTSAAGKLIYTVAQTFLVSEQAASIRLTKLKYLVSYDTSPNLFEN